MTTQTLSGLMIDGKPLEGYHVGLDTEVIAHPSIVQLTGTRAACKALIWHLGCELRQRARYGDETYRLHDDRGTYVGQFHDTMPPSLVFKIEWFNTQA
jgi:hypothetical protein